MNSLQKHIAKMTEVDLYYRNYCEKITSFYKVRKRLRGWSKEYVKWDDFKRFSEWVRD